MTLVSFLISIFPCFVGYAISSGGNDRGEGIMFVIKNGSNYVSLSHETLHLLGQLHPKQYSEQFIEPIKNNGMVIDVMGHPIMI
jgi:hypothetical protein